MSLAGDELIQALVNQELKDRTWVRWKKMIAPKFNQILELKGNQAKSHRTLKRRLEYVSTLSTANMCATFSDNPGHASISDAIEIDGNNIDNCPVQEYINSSMLSDDYFISKKLYPNVDFYSGIILDAMGFPVSMFTPIFALSRTVGWISQ